MENLKRDASYPKKTRAIPPVRYIAKVLTIGAVLCLGILFLYNGGESSAFLGERNNLAFILMLFPIIFLWATDNRRVPGYLIAVGCVSSGTVFLLVPLLAYPFQLLLGWFLFLFASIVIIVGLVGAVIEFSKRKSGFIPVFTALLALGGDFWLKDWL